MDYLIQKVIRNREYYYLDIRLTRFSDGGKEVVSHYLGPRPPSDQRGALTLFFEVVGDTAGARTDEKERTPLGRDAIRRIERARFWYHRLHLDPFMADLERFQRHFTVLFILNSNKAEGSRVERGDLEKAMGRKREPRSQIDLEISNSIDAMAFAFSKDMRWSGPGIKKVHELMFRGLQPKIAGQYKKVDNIAGGGQDVITSGTTPWKNVPKEMIRLMRWFRGARKARAYPPWLAMELYWRFERIHPFEDGNGRVGRILMNAVLQERGFMPVIFDERKYAHHSSCIGKAIRGNPRPLGSFLGEQTKWTLKRMEAYGKEVQDGDWKRRIAPWQRTKWAGILYDSVGEL